MSPVAHCGASVTAVLSVAAALIVVSSGIGDRRASACSCFGRKPPLEALPESDAVFAGIAVTRKAPPPSPDSTVSSGDPVTYAFEITHVWKGAGVDTLSVTTARGEESCGYEFCVGGWYLVYARNRSGRLHTDICTRTSPVEHAFLDLFMLPEPVQVNPARSLPEVTIPGLIEMLEDPDGQTRRLAAVALGDIAAETEETTHALAVMLRRDDPLDRSAACIALGRIGRDAHVMIPELLLVLREDDDENTRVQAMKALALIGGSPDLMVPALAAALQREGFQGRYAALHSLRDIGPAAGPAVDAIIECLSAEDKRIRSAAITALGRIGERLDLVIPALVHLLGDGEVEDRRTAAWALGSIGPPASAAIPALTAAAKEDESRSVRRHAGEALSKIASGTQ